MTSGPENDPEFSDTIKPRSGRSFKLGELLAALAVIAVLIALCFPATRSARPAARRAQCMNNLKNIGLALHHYEQAHHAFPPAYTVDAHGRPLHSWRTLILPYLEQNPLYEMIDLTKPWDDPVNAAAATTQVAAYICPDLVESKNTTTYLAIVGADGFLAPSHPRRVEEITDGPSSTLALIEVDREVAVPWMSPLDADADTVMNLNAKAKLPHAGSTHSALADGSVRTLMARTPAPMRRALVSISGHDNDAIKDW